MRIGSETDRRECEGALWRVFGGTGEIHRLPRHATLGGLMNRWGNRPTPVPGRVGKMPDDASWDEREIAKLKELRADNMSARLIADRLNRTVKSVEAKIAELRAVRR